MRVLFVSNLFPDSREPERGVVNARVLRRLGEHCEIRVISPRPTLRFGFLASGHTDLAACPVDAPLQPVYPPAWYIPKVGSRFNHTLLARSIRREVARARATFDFDVVLSAWVYPDACAVSLLSGEFAKPFVVIAQGSDVHEYLENPVRRRIIASSLAISAGIIARSGELARLLREVGVKPTCIHVIYNGVDSDAFRPGDRAEARKILALPQNDPVLLYVGNFDAIKNPSLLVTAFVELRRRNPGRRARLVMIGKGVLQGRLEAEVAASGFAGEIRLAGQKSQQEVVRYMSAADVLCVSSDNEGVANVVLEAFACGLPVVSTRVGGIPEVLSADFLGRLTPQGDRHAMAGSIEEVLGSKPDSNRIREYALKFSWEETAAKYLELLSGAVAKKPEPTTHG
jgi:teichuronic acid biosynthesis glycosyltransferase TuaC